MSKSQTNLGHLSLTIALPAGVEGLDPKWIRSVVPKVGSVAECRDYAIVQPNIGDPFT